MRRAHLVLAIGASIALGSIVGQAHAAGEPAIATAKTGDDGDGHIETVTITFTAPMQATSPSSSWFAAAPGDPGFSVDGYQVLAAVWEPSGQPTATSLKLGMVAHPEYDTGATPALHYTPVANGPKAAVSGLALTATPASGVESIDGAGPILIRATATDLSPVNLFNIAGDQMRLGFSEPVSLLGAGATRAANLENAVRFLGVSSEGANGCPFDGTAAQNQNFPQQQTGTSPIDPADPQTFSDALTVTMQTGNVASVQRFSGVPRGCVLGIDPQNNRVLVDGAGNPASPYTLPSLSRPTYTRIQPRDTAVLTVKTTDGVGSIPDGIADGVEIVAGAPLDDATVDAFATSLVLTDGGVALTNGVADTGKSGDARARVAVTTPTNLSGLRARGSRDPSCVHAPSGTSGGGPKATVLYADTFRSCLDSFDVAVTDGVGPAVLDAMTADLDADGVIDAVTVRFSEPVEALTAAGWTLGGTDATAATLAADPRSAILMFAESGTVDGATTPTLGYDQDAGDTIDAAGNEPPATSRTTSDGVGPAIASAQIADLDGDGHVDEVRATLSEAGSLVGTPRFTYDGIGSVRVTLDETTLVIGFDGPTGSAASDLVVLGGGIRDASGAPIPASTFPAAQIPDAVAPTALITVAPSAPIPAGQATVRVAFTEPMADAPISVTKDGAALGPATDAEHTANGFRNDDASVWEGGFTVASTDCTVSTGCPVSFSSSGGNDLGGLATVGIATLDTLIDTVAPAAPEVATTDAIGGNAAPGVVNQTTANLAVNVRFAGDADGGTAEGLVDGGAMTVPLIGDLAPGTDRARLVTSYGSRQDLRAALGGEGAHTLSIELCDGAGNCTTGPATNLTVDSVPAEVLLESLGEPTVAAAGTNLPLTWQTEETQGVTVDLRYSTDGRRWTAIALNRPASGTVSWKVPFVDATARVRVVSHDAAGNVGTDEADAPLIVRRVGGVVADGNGRVAGFGTLSGVTTKRFTNPVVRDVVLRADRKTGYTLTKNGGLASFGLGGARAPRAPRGVALPGTARELLLVTAASGYIVDTGGRLHAFGGAARAIPSKTWPGDRARDAILLPNRKGGYVLDLDGRAHPFRIGAAKMPVRIQGSDLTNSAVALILRSNGRSGWVLDAARNLHRFGGALEIATTGPGNAIGGFKVTDTAGYWIDASGKFKAWGAMIGDPTRTTFAAGTARASA